MAEVADPSRSQTIKEITIVIVGPCASGKSTLAANLRAAGLDARVSGQEHSEISYLWSRMEPDVVVALHIDLETLRSRRGPTWSARLFDHQMRRLREAYAAADLHLDTATLDESQALAHVLDMVRHNLSETD